MYLFWDHSLFCVCSKSIITKNEVFLATYLYLLLPSYIKITGLELEPQSLAQLLTLFKCRLGYAILLGLTVCFDGIVHYEVEKIVIINLVNSRIWFSVSFTK